MNLKISFLLLLFFSFNHVQAQCLSGDCANGIGKFKYKNDDVYDGSFKDGYPNGKGKMQYSSGDMYEGDWVKGNWNGKGVYTWKDGRFYKGDVKDSYFEGKGFFTLSNGDKYEGSFVLGKYEGYGVYFFADGRRYEGDWVKGIKSGKGKFYFVNGSVYDGAWKDNKFNGFGKYQYTDSTYGEGMFVDGKQNGKGKFKSESGVYYEGDLIDAKPNGKGKVVYKSGDRYEGDFVEGFVSGEGSYKYKNGDIYEGGFVKGLKEGKGKMVYASGSVYQGEWKNNLRSGIGKWIFANQDNYDGSFINDRPENGKFYKREKLFYEGKFDSPYYASNGKNFLTNDGRFFEKIGSIGGDIFRIYQPVDTVFIVKMDNGLYSDLNRTSMKEGFILLPSGKAQYAVFSNNKIQKITEERQFKPGDAFSDYVVGRMFFNKGQYLIPVKYFTQALSNGSKEDSLFLYRGISYSKLAKQDSAIIDFETAVKKMPANSDANRWLSNSYLLKKDTAAALVVLDKYLKKNTKDTAALWDRGNLYFRQKKYDKTIEDYNAILKNSKGNLDNLYYYRGLCNEYLGRKEEACKDYNVAATKGNASAKTKLNGYCKM